MKNRTKALLALVAVASLFIAAASGVRFLENPVGFMAVQISGTCIGLWFATEWRGEKP